MSYEAYGADGVYDELIPNWRIYRVLMISTKGENTFVKVCLPVDESEPALASDKEDETCSVKTKAVDKEKKKNQDYLAKIRKNNFFKKKKTAETKKSETSETHTNQPIQTK